MGAIAVFAIMTTASVIDMEIGAAVDPLGEQFILFRMKELLIINE